MSKFHMLRGFFRFTFILSLLFAFCFIHLWYKKAEYTSQFLSKVLRTPVTVEDVSFSTRQLTLNKVYLSNPKGSRQATLLSLDSLSFTFDSWNSQEIVIDRITISSPLVTIDQKGWALLLNRLQMNGVKESAHYVILVNNMEVTDLTYRIPLYPIQPKSIPSVEIVNFASKKPLSSKMMIAACFRHLLEIAEQQEIAENFSDSLRPVPKEIVIGGTLLTK